MASAFQVQRGRGQLHDPLHQAAQDFLPPFQEARGLLLGLADQLAAGTLGLGTGLRQARLQQRLRLGAGLLQGRRGLGIGFARRAAAFCRASASVCSACFSASRTLLTISCISVRL